MSSAQLDVYWIDLKVILIDHFNGIEVATNFLAEHASACAISVITRADVLAGCEQRTGPMARRLLDAFTALPITPDIADVAAALRRSEHWTLPDALQAAIALRHDLMLVTRNTRDFQPGGHVEVLVPYRL